MFLEYMPVVLDTAQVKTKVIRNEIQFFLTIYAVKSPAYITVLSGDMKSISLKVNETVF